MKKITDKKVRVGFVAQSERMRKGAIIALLALLGSADAAKKKGAKSEKQ